MDERFRARACLSTYVVFACMTGFPLIFCAISIVRHDFLETKMWQMALISIGALCFSFVWIRAYQVTVENGRLEYRSLWRGRQTVQLSKIKRAKHETGIDGPFTPPFRVVVHYMESDQPRSICINLKVFSLSDARRIHLLLNAE
jgi:hypothetical protein